MNFQTAYNMFNERECDASNEISRFYKSWSGLTKHQTTRASRGCVSNRMAFRWMRELCGPIWAP